MQTITKDLIYQVNKLKKYYASEQFFLVFD